MIRIISLIIIFSAINPDANYAYERYWGRDYNKFIASIDKTIKYSIFDPREKPDYKNRVVDFITSLNNESNKDIKIIRVMVTPETDYLFFNGRLCAVTENRGVISIKDGEIILKNLTKKFGIPQKEKKSSLYIYTFQQRRTRVILYQQLIDNNSMRCKVYGYTNDIFNSLFSD
jgi:hypothetical protein